MEVTHDNRHIEFIDLKKSVGRYIEQTYWNHTFPYSCEQIAYNLADTFNFDRVEVLEDNENGGIYIKDCGCKK
jgi:hypothetical protein